MARKARVDANAVRKLGELHGGKTRVKDGFAHVSFTDPMDSADFRCALIKTLGVEVARQEIGGAGAMCFRKARIVNVVRLA